jgi:acyl dehydratase
MIPLAAADFDTGHHDALRLGAADLPDDDLLDAVRDWDLPSPSSPAQRAGERIAIAGADVVSNAPELARLTLNIAAVHHDAVAAGGRRLVYGGHTIAIALAQASRAVPGLLTVLGWHSADHVAPVHEGDRLTSSLQVERVVDAPSGGRLLHLRSRVFAQGDAGEDTLVLDWRFVGFTA